MADDKPSPYPQQQPPPGAQYPPPAYGGPTQPAYPPPAPPGYPGSVAQPGGYPGTATTTTIIQQPTAVAISTIGFGESPVAMSCPNCKMSIVTATSYVTGTLTWLACLGLCVVGYVRTTHLFFPLFSLKHPIFDSLQIFVNNQKRFVENECFNFELLCVRFFENIAVLHTAI